METGFSKRSLKVFVGLKFKVHPCESKIAPALNFDGYFLRLILLSFSFLETKLVLGFLSITLAKNTTEINLNCLKKIAKR